MIGRIRKTALVFICCGVIMQVGTVFIPESAETFREYMSIIASGFMLVGIVRLVKLLRVSRDPDAAEDLENAATDERLQFIVSRARSLTMIISVTAEIACSLIAILVFGNRTVGNVLNYTACAQCVIYTLTYRILEKKF